MALSFEPKWKNGNGYIHYDTYDTIAMIRAYDTFLLFSPDDYKIVSANVAGLQPLASPKQGNSPRAFQIERSCEQRIICDDAEV